MFVLRKTLKPCPGSAGHRLVMSVTGEGKESHDCLPVTCGRQILSCKVWRGNGRSHTIVKPLSPAALTGDRRVLRMEGLQLNAERLHSFIRLLAVPQRPYSMMGLNLFLAHFTGLL